MNNRIGPTCTLALLTLFVSAEAISRTPPPQLSNTTVLVRGVVRDLDTVVGIAEVGDYQVYIGDLVANFGFSVSPGDEVLLIGTPVNGSDFIWAIGMDFPARLNAESITGTGKQSITGTGVSLQSITGTGKQSITGTGVSLQSITGTGKQSITGTGVSLQSITGTGKQSITGTGVSLQSITGTGKQSITGTGVSLQSITGTGK